MVFTTAAADARIGVRGRGRPADHPLDVYKTNLSGWLRDSTFWSDITGRVRFWAQEVYPDIRDWAVPGASREQRTQHLADYLMHPLALADSLAADPTSAARAASSPIPT